MMWNLLGGDQPSRGKIDRQVKKVVHPHGESINRMAAIQQLMEWGTAESIAGIMKRFTIVASPVTLDMEEKQQVCDMLIGIGREAVGPLHRFLREEVQIYWPARALQAILGDEEFKETMAEILMELQTSYVRVADQKRDLLRHVSGLVHERLFQAAEGFLEDPSDDVRIAALEYLFSVPNEPRRSAILDAVLQREQSARFWMRFSELAAEKQWNVPTQYRDVLQKQLPPDFSMNSRGELKQRPRKT